MMAKKWATLHDINGFVGVSKLKTLSNSARSAFTTCRRRFQYEYEYGLKPLDINVPFLIGGMFHDELSRFYTGEWSIKGMKERTANSIEKVLKTVFDENVADKLWEQRAIVIGMLSGYNKWYAGDLKRWTNIKAETEFAVDIPHSGGWKYVGKVDMNFNDKKKWVLCEHKSTSILDVNYIARLPLDFQIMGYLWGTWRATDKLADEILYNVVKKSQLRLGAAEKFKNYLNRVEQDYLTNKGKYFYREPLRFSINDLKTFAIELRKFTSDIEAANDRDFFYMNTSSCTTYGKCMFMPLCINGVNNETLRRYRRKEKLHEELEEIPS